MENVPQKDYESDTFTEERYKQFFLNFNQDTCTILDIGCSTGRGGTVLKKLDPKIKLTGLDIDEERLKRIPEGIYDLKVLGSANEIPFDDNKYDTIVAGEFIEHIPVYDVDKTIYEMFRVLKLGGRVLLTTPNPKYIKRRAEKGTILEGTHLSQHHHDALRMKLRMAGFSRLKIYGSGKVTRYLGYRFFFLCVYGDYLIMGDKF